MKELENLCGYFLVGIGMGALAYGLDIPAAQAVFAVFAVTIGLHWIKSPA
jgi:hypothetical protein